MKIFGWTITITRGTPATTPEAGREHRNHVAMSRSAVADPELIPGDRAVCQIHRDELPLIERVLRGAEQAQGYRRAAGLSTISVRTDRRLSGLHGRFGALAAVEPNPATVPLMSHELSLLRLAIDDLDFLPGSESLIVEGRRLLEDLDTRRGFARVQRQHTSTIGSAAPSTVGVALSA